MMPRSIIVACIALLLILVIDAVSVVVAFKASAAVAPSLVGFGIASMVLVGTASGHRLAWLFGRTFILLGAVAATALPVAMLLAVITNFPHIAFRQPDMVWAATGITFILFCASLLWGVFFAFGRHSARVFFRLVCPKCDAVTNKAADVLFSRAKCRSCGNVW